MIRRANLIVFLLALSAFAVANIASPPSARVYGQPSTNTITAFVGVAVVPMDFSRILQDQVVVV
jgi:hypothetical protein